MGSTRAYTVCSWHTNWLIRLVENVSGELADAESEKMGAVRGGNWKRSRSSGRGARTLTPLWAGAFKAPVSAIPPSRRWHQYSQGKPNVNISATWHPLDLMNTVVVFALAADIGAIAPAEEHEQTNADQNQREDLPKRAGDIAN